MDEKTLIRLIAQILYEKKATDIDALHVGHLTIITEDMIIASGRNAQHVRMLADEVEERLSMQGIEPRHKEGQNEARWVILDYGYVMVHIFHPQERAYYRLERLWEDGNNRIDFSFAKEDTDFLS